MTFRFFGGTVLCVLLIVASALFLTNDYQKRVEKYLALVKEHKGAIDRANTYSFIIPYFDRKPKVLSIFCEGIGDKYGNSARIPGKYGGVTISGGARDNLFLSSFPTVDFTFIVSILLTLMALLFTYDSVAGEKEQGTLKQALTNSVPRDTFLIGKYLGIMLNLLLPLSFSSIFGLLVITLSGKVHFTPEDYLRVGLISLFSLFLISFFVLLGMFLSANFKKASTALMSILFLWVFVVVVYPNFSSWLATRLFKVEENLENNPFQSFAGYKSPENMKEEVKREDLLRNQMVKQYRFYSHIAHLSPVKSYSLSASAVAGTDLGNHLDFVNKAKEYNRVFTQWQQEKLKLYPEKEFSYTSADPDLDVSGLPQFVDGGEDLPSSAARASTNLIILLLFNILFFVGAYVSFLKYDPR